MLNLKNINRLLLISVLTLFMLVNFRLINPLYSLLPFLIYPLFLIYGSIYIKSNFYFKSLKKLSNSKAVLLTFDDGPDPDITPQVLKLLDDYDRKAIFFLIGEKAIKYPELIKEIHQRGHVIGNHSYTHEKWFDMRSSSIMIQELKQTNAVLENSIGEEIAYFRPPYGVTNPNLRRALINTKLKSIAWSFRSFDTGKQSATQISQRLEKEIKGGDILLFHDNREKALEVLKRSLPFLTKFEQGDIDDEIFD
jgi:peptidoglycan/xylan/chitin deacetylase (PgdA/CDA1 family)